MIRKLELQASKNRKSMCSESEAGIRTRRGLGLLLAVEKGGTMQRLGPDTKPELQREKPDLTWPS